MKLSEALERVGAIYVPGVVKYYGQLNPDPWQAAHDELEKVAGIFDEDIVSAATARFVSRCEELVKRFKQDGQQSKSVSPADAMALGSTQRVSAHLSRRFKKCCRCDAKKDLKIVPVGDGSMDVQVICEACAKNGTT